MKEQIDFLLELMDFVEDIKRDTHEESVKFSRLNTLQTMIKKQLEDVCKMAKNQKKEMPR